LLDVRLLDGAIVTSDAMGCLRDIADFVLVRKGNQSALLSWVQKTFDAIEQVPLTYANDIGEYQQVEKGHGRIETRLCVATEISWQRKSQRWPGLRSIVMLESTREIGDPMTIERRYCVSSLPPDAPWIARAVRSRWGIENGMHWCLDMAFGEDQSRVRVDNAAQIFAIVRRIAMNLLRHDVQTKAGLKTRRHKASCSDRYRAQLLGW
jgi:predicted transposase YbfD/YdcC